MILFKATREYLGWMRALLRKIAGLTPGYLLLNIFLYGFSELASFFAFFLPLKILILVGTTGVPAYLKLMFVTQENKAEAIIVLSVGAVLLFLLSLNADKLTQRCSEKAGAKLMLKSKKVAILRNGTMFATTVYQKLTTTLGGLLMGITGMAAGFYLNPPIFLLLSASCVVEYFVFVYMVERAQKPERHQEKIKLQSTARKRIGFCSNINFYAGFACLVYVFYVDQNFGLLKGFLSFILMQRVMKWFVLAVKGALYLNKNKYKINALFFTNTAYQPKISSHEIGFVEMLALDKEKKWISGQLEAQGIEHDGRWVWHDLPEKNIALLESKSTEDNRSVYVKLFAPSQAGFCAHEKAFFSKFSSTSPLVPELITDFEYCGFVGFVYSAPEACVHDSAVVKKMADKARVDLWTIRPDDKLVSKCKRSRPVLVERFDEALIDNLSIAASTPEDYAMIEATKKEMPNIRAVIESMPYIVTAPKFKSGYLLFSEQQPMLFSLGKWSVDHLGAGTPFKYSYQRCKEIFDEVSVLRSDFGDLKPEDYFIVSAASKIEQLILRQDYRMALGLLPTLLQGDFTSENGSFLDNDNDSQCDDIDG